MILVAGGTGTLGTQVVRLLVDRGQDVRVLTRDPARTGRLPGTVQTLAPSDSRSANIPPPSLGSVPVPTSSSKTSAGDSHNSIIRAMLAACDVNVERFAASDW